MNTRELINNVCDELHHYQYGNTAIEDLEILEKLLYMQMKNYLVAYLLVMLN